VSATHVDDVTHDVVSDVTCDVKVVRRF